MVATVLKLRYRVLANTLARRPWQLVGFILSSLWGLGMLSALVAGVIALAIFQGPEVASVVVILGGSLLLLGWVVGPILVAGVESTVDAARLAPFPLTRRQVMAALAGAGITGIPGIVTMLAALATVILWIRWPIAAIVAVPSVALGVLTCVLASRLMSELSGGLGGNRRGREVVGTIVLVLVIMAGPITLGILNLLDSAGGDLVTRLQQAAQILPWTPIGAAWSIAPSVAAGEWALALARAAIAVATVVLLWIVWARVLDAAATSPRQRATKAVAAGRIGLFGVLPTGGIGATWARALHGWLRDPRYLRQLITIPLFPVLFAFLGGVDGFGFVVSPVIAALVLSIAGYTDISYDGSAFAAVLSTGVRGRDDRLGRILGAAVIGIPVIVLVAVATALIAGDPARLPATLGASLGILFAGYAVCAVSSTLIVTPVAAPGDSPFKSVPGQSAVSGLLVFLVWGIVVVLSLPAIGPALIGVASGAEMWGWLSLAAGLVVGAVLIVVGVHVGGRMLERNGPDLLMRIKAFPT